MLGICLDITERKRVEHTLRVSEERYRALVETAPDGIVVHQDGRFVFANPAALRLYGADTLEQFLGRRVVDYIHPDDREAIAGRMRRATDGQLAPQRETRLVRLDGRAVAVESGGARVEFEGKPGVQVIIRDVTERKQAEQALAEAHARAVWLARFPDENPQAVLRVSADGLVLYCNPAAQRLSGWSCRAGDCPPDALRPLVRRALTESRHLAEDVSLGARTYSVSVASFPEERYVNVYGTDVTERKQAEAALQAAHDALEQKVRERTQALSEVNQTLRMISECNEAVVRAGGEAELVQQICNILHQLGRYRMAWVGYAEDDPDKTVRPVAKVGVEEGYLEQTRITWDDGPLRADRELHSPEDAARLSRFPHRPRARALARGGAAARLSLLHRPAPRLGAACDRRADPLSEKPGDFRRGAGRAARGAGRRPGLRDRGPARPRRAGSRPGAGRRARGPVAGAGDRAGTGGAA